MKPPSQTDHGILYVATGARYMAEARNSAQSVKQLMPDLPLAIVTDSPEVVADFDHFIRLEPTGVGFPDKVRGLALSPFRKTLFLDTDTRLAQPVPEIFDLLERFDFVAAHDVWRFGREVGVPDCLPEFNSGVIGFRATPAWRALRDDWESLLREELRSVSKTFDQACLRQAFYRSSVRPYVLTSEYNFRTIFPNLVGNRASVKIFHGRESDWEAVSRLVNRDHNPRLWAGSLRSLVALAIVRKPRGQKILGLLRRLLRA